MAGKRLGCGVHQVFLTSVGGSGRSDQLEWTNLNYGRKLDEKSEGRVVAGVGQSAACLTTLQSLEPFSNEIVIHRDSAAVWSGPVETPVFTYDDVSIPARDVMQWLDRRWLAQTHGYVDVDLSLIAAYYIDDALSQDSSPNIEVSSSLSGILGTRSVVPTQFRRAADEIRELARTGLDWTVINRRIMLFGVEMTGRSFPILTSDIFEIENASPNGLQKANDIAVIGSGTSGVSLGPVGRAGGADIPLIQQSYSEPTILDQNSATVAAESRYAFTRTAPLYITGRLLESAPVDFDDLIPGIRVPVQQQVGVRYINDTFRLSAVDVSAEHRDDGYTEAVRLTLTPLGAVEE